MLSFLFQLQIADHVLASLTADWYHQDYGTHVLLLSEWTPVDVSIAANVVR